MDHLTDAAERRRYAELAARAASRGICQWTRFLSPAQRAAAAVEAAKAGVRLASWGGTEEAERRICAFTDDPDDPDWSGRMTCLRIAWNGKFGKVGHRDLLGALLGTGIDREHLGDILVAKDEAYVFATRETARLLAESVTQVGRASVRIEEAELPEAFAAESEGTEIRTTVPSLRLDALIAACWDLSRGAAQEAVSQQRVQVNYLPEIRPDRQLDEGDLISLRGAGRCRLAGTGGRNRKNRISVMLLRY